MQAVMGHHMVSTHTQTDGQLSTTGNRPILLSQPAEL